MRQDIESALCGTNVANGCACSVEFKRAEFEGEPQFCRRHFWIDAQEFVERRLSAPRPAAIGHEKVISQHFTTKVDGGNAQVEPGTSAETKRLSRLSFL